MNFMSVSRFEHPAVRPVYPGVVKPQFGERQKLPETKVHAFKSIMTLEQYMDLAPKKRDKLTHIYVEGSRIGGVWKKCKGSWQKIRKIYIHNEMPKNHQRGALDAIRERIRKNCPQPSDSKTREDIVAPEYFCVEGSKVPYRCGLDDKFKFGYIA